MKPESRAAQASGHIDPQTRALVPPVQLSTTFERDADGSYPAGFEYTRADNPGYEVPERLLAELEGGSSAMLFSSGMAAATSVFCALVPGDHVVAPQVMYWALRKWISEFALTWGVTVTYVDPGDLDDLAAAVRPGRTRIVWAETPANPTWTITDLSGAAGIAHRRRRPPGGRQHGVHARPYPSDRFRRRPGGPFRHQVPERARRRPRRGGGGPGR